MNENQLLDVLTRKGVLINASVRFWRGCKKLKAEDLGLDPSKVSDRLISLGHKRLLPKDATAALALVEGRAHALVEANTFPFLNGLAHFLPNAKLEEVTAKLKELEVEFWKAQVHFLGQYQTLRESASLEWREMARKLTTDPQRVIETIEASFPDPQQISRHFGFDVQLFQISLPAKLSARVLAEGEQAEIIRARRDAAAAASEKIRLDTEAFVADCVASLRQETATLCAEMLASINSGKTEGIHQKTLNRLIHFIDQFKQMNFANDTVMEEQLDRVRRELLTRSAEEYRDNSLAHQGLVAGLSRLSAKARELAQENASELVRQFGELGRRKFSLAA